MRVVLAPDGFGGTMSASAAAEAMATGWRRAAPDDELRLVPLSDGGAGLLDVLVAALPDASLVPLTVEDPLSRPVAAAFLLDGTTAYVESAQACGLHLLAPDELDPLRTTTYGVGQLIRGALDAGATRIVVGLGGTATNDGGAGMLAALGIQRLDAAGERLAPGGAALAGIVAVAGDLDPRLRGVELVAATDVDAPLLGLRGASNVFGPQKGADQADVQVLDAALTRWADVLEARFSKVRGLVGAGAGGGLGAALFALGARRAPGIELVQELVGLAGHLDGARVVLTGEGTFDVTSLTGKVVTGVSAAAAAEAVPCVVLAGQVAVGRREVAAAGLESALSMADLVGLDAALSDPAGSLATLTERVARQWSR
ncbi:MAG: Glycerate kinase [Frankiales bacterium]|nr:Glycerate kinase [Frankiales bacterium]